MPKRATHLTLFVSDQERSLDFYTRVLGLECRVDRPGVGGGRYLTVGVPGDVFEIALWPGTPGKPPAGYAPGAVVLETADCRGEVEALRGRGAEIDPPGVLEQPVAFVAVLRDPDGNRIMLREPRAAG